jgi:ABC-2 type transport system permease protein
VRPVWLVARREIRERIRARSFRIATVVSVLLVVAGITIPKLTGGKTPTYDVAVVSGTDLPAAQLRSLEPALDVKLKVHTVADLDTAREQIHAETLDMAVDGETILARRAPRADDASKTAQLVAALSNLVRFQRIAKIAGPQAIAALSAPVTVSGVEAPEANIGDRVTAFFGVLLLFAFLQQYGTWVLMGVIEEKASRVVEVLLAATKPWRLLAGKVLGIGAVATMQGLLVAVAALVTASVSRVSTSERTICHTGAAPMPIIIGIIIGAVNGMIDNTWWNADGVPPPMSVVVEMYDTSSGRKIGNAAFWASDCREHSEPTAA